MLIFGSFTALPASLFPVNTTEELYSILMDITDENSEERRTSFKKITQEEEEKDPSTEAGEGRWWRRGGVRTVSLQTDGASQFPPGTRGKTEREKSVPLLENILFFYTFVISNSKNNQRVYKAYICTNLFLCFW